MIASVIHINQQSIDRVIGSGLPIALIFWRDGDISVAEEARLESLAHRYEGRALICKVNVQNEPTLARHYHVTTTPTAVIIRHAKTIDSLAPAELAKYIESWLDHLAFGRPSPRFGPRPAQATPRPSVTSDAHPITLTDASFGKAIQADQPVLVDFWAAWCGPCRMIAPAVEQLAREFAGRAVVGKLNVDENPATAQRYQVMSIPTLLIFKRGEEVDRIVGAQPPQVLHDRLAYHAN